MRLFPVVFTTNSAGFPGDTFSRLFGSSVIWGTAYKAERKIKRDSILYLYNREFVFSYLYRNCLFKLTDFNELIVVCALYTAAKYTFCTRSNLFFSFKDASPYL